MKSGDLLTVPITLAIAAIVPYLLPILGPLQWLSSLAVHEPGHALASLFAGQLSIPTPFYTVPFTDMNNSIVVVFMVSLALVLCIWGYKVDSYLAMITGFSILSLQIICTFLIPDSSAKSLILIAGLGAELILSLVYIFSFYLSLPPRFNWNRNRYLFLIIGSLTFCSAIQVWLTAPYNQSVIPMGAAIDFGLMNSGQSGGDLDRLIRDHGWTLDGLVQLYWWLTITAIALAISGYIALIGLWKKSGN